MTKPDPVRVTVRYLGVVRLMSGRRQDVLEFTCPVSVGDLVLRLKELLPASAYQEIARQSLVLAPVPNTPGLILKLPEELDKLIEDGNCLTVVTPVTGG